MLLIEYISLYDFIPTLGIRGWLKNNYKNICSGTGGANNQVRLKVTNHPGGLKEEKCYFLHGLLNNNIRVKTNVDCDTKTCMYCEKINP